MKKLIGLAVLGILMASGACLAAEIDPIKICDKQGCYGEDALGGYGVKPQRTFKLEYDGSPVCKVIQTALNDAIKNPEEAEKRITHPVPVRMDLIDPVVAQKIRDNPLIYRSQNPLFSDPIFLQWNFLAGDPTIDTEHYWGYNSRWILINYKNNDQIFLFTTHPGGLYHDGPPVNPMVWNITQEQLSEKDWSVPSSYKGFHGLGDETGAGDPVRLLIFPNPAQDTNSKFPKKLKTLELKSYWKNFSLGRFIYWAKIDDKIYTILFDRFDRVVVAYVNQNSVNHLCYLDSSFTEKIYREIIYREDHSREYPPESN